jgi:hypothetical protein
MAEPRLTPGHAKFEKLAGTWRGEETMHASQWVPEAVTAQGTNTCRVALNGFAVINDYVQTRDGATTFSGHGVLNYAPETDEYRLTWFDCMSNAPEIFRGRFEGDVLRLESGAGPMSSRLTYDFSRTDVWSAHMEMRAGGEGWGTVFEAAYRRVAAD